MHQLRSHDDETECDGYQSSQDSSDTIVDILVHGAIRLQCGAYEAVQKTSCDSADYRDDHSDVDRTDRQYESYDGDDRCGDQGFYR